MKNANIKPAEVQRVKGFWCHPDLLVRDSDGLDDCYPWEPTFPTSNAFLLTIHDDHIDGPQLGSQFPIKAISMRLTLLETELERILSTFDVSLQTEHPQNDEKPLDNLFRGCCEWWTFRDRFLLACNDLKVPLVCKST